MDKVKKILNLVVKICKWITLLPTVLDFLENYSKNDNVNKTNK